MERTSALCYCQLMHRFQSYVICTSPRSGSTLLCQLLDQAGNAGHPDSHFHQPDFEKWLSYYSFRTDQFSVHNDALKAIFQAAHARGKGKSDIFGLRLQRPSFDFFAEQLSLLHPSMPDDKSRINAVFGNTLFIHLTRQNKLDQAVSYVKARQSGLWHLAADGTELERLSEPKEPRYDSASIAAQLALFEQMEAEWNAWFHREGITPLRITYDELAAVPCRTLSRILKTLGLAYPQRNEITPPTAKMADATNKDWVERFLSEKRR